MGFRPALFFGSAFTLNTINLTTFQYKNRGSPGQIPHFPHTFDPGKLIQSPGAESLLELGPER